MKKIILSILLIFYINAAYTQLVSDTLGCVPLLVKYKSPNAQASNILWDFGDGTSSDKINPSHVYSTNGLFTIKVYDNNILLAAQKIEVLSEPILEFDALNNEGCAPLDVSFLNTSIVPSSLGQVSYLWSFGDGNTSNIPNPVYTYNNKGIYDVGLNLISNIPQCNVTKTFVDVVNVKGKHEFDFIIDSVSSSCKLPIKVFITYVGTIDDSIKYFWNFGNGTSSTKAMSSPVEYNSEGNFSIKLKTDNGTGCIDSISKPVIIKTNKSNFNIKMQDTLCINTYFFIENKSAPGKYFWDFGENTAYKTTNEFEPKGNVYSKAGQQSIHLNYIDNQGCMFDTIILKYVEDPIADFDIIDSIVCSLPATFKFYSKVQNHKFYYWNNKIGLANNEIKMPYVKRDSFYYNDTIKKVMNLSIISKNGCKGDVAKFYKVILPNALFEVNYTKGAAPFTLKIFDKSESLYPIKKYVITWGDGTSTTYDKNTINTASHIYAEPGNYYVNMSIVNENGCEDLYYGVNICVTKDISIGGGVTELPDVIGISEICAGKKFELNKDSIPTNLPDFHINLGYANDPCNNYNTDYSITEDPGTYEVETTYILGYDTYTRIDTIKVIGAKAKATFEVKCNDQLNVTFRDSSLNATNAFWVIDNDTLRGKSILYRFKEFGMHTALLYAINEKDESCGYSKDSVALILQQPKAKITAQEIHCFADTIILSAFGSVDAKIGCRHGYTWKFDDESKQNILTAQTEVRTKLNPGINKISLIVRDENGCRDTAYKTIKVLNLKADFMANFPKVCDSLIVTFKDATVHDTALVSWKWNIDNKIKIGEISHLFTNLPDSTVKIRMEVKDAFGCTNVIEKLIKVFKPEMDLIMDSIYCESAVIKFEAKNKNPKDGKLKYNWVLDNKMNYANSPIVLKNITPLGYHTIKVVGTDSLTKCKTRLEAKFKLLSKPEAIISKLEDSIFCFPKSIKFNGSESTFDSEDTPRYSWAFDNGNASSNVAPLETFNKGTYKVRLIARSKYGCNDTAFTKITLVGPEGKITADKIKICKSDEVTFTLKDQKDVTSFYWDFGQGETLENVNPAKYKYKFLPSSGKTFVSLVMQSERNCEAVLSLPIELFNVEANFDGLASCDSIVSIANNSLGSKIFQWLWNGQEVSNNEEPKITFPGKGKYTLVLKASDSNKLCTDTISKVITILQNPKLNLNDITLCKDYKYAFLKTPGITYTFEPSNIVNLVNDTFYIASEKSTVLKILTVSDEICKAEKTININQLNVEQNDVFDTIVVCGTSQSFELLKMVGDVITWQFQNGNISEKDLSCLDCSNPTIKEGAFGDVIISIKNNDLCRDRTIRLAVYNPKVELPNVFTPNGDGDNEIFRPVMIPKAEQDKLNIESFLIFNRWGKEVASLKSPWDGLIDGEKAAAEVYYFVIKYNIANGCQTTIKGNVTLIR